MSPNLAAVPLPSASTIAATESTGTHILKIRGYSQAKLLLSPGHFIESAKFDAAGQSWRIKVFPNSNREKAAGYMSLFLVLASEQAKDVRASLRFSFVRQDGKLTAKPHGGTCTSAPHTFVSTNHDWGFTELVTREELEKPEYLKDDTILVRCDITVLNEPVVQRHDDLATLELLCDCGDDQCKNLHAGDTNKPAATAPGKKMQSHLGYVPLPHDVAPPAPLPSASTIAVMVSTGCHVVQISGFSRTKMLFENGKYVSSAEFTEAGHAWQIRCYPNGESKENAGYISLFLHQTDESTNVVRAKFHLSLVPHGGKLTKTPHVAGRTNTTMTFPAKKCVFGVGDFMKIEALENSEYLKDDSFSIRCDIAVMNVPVVAQQDLETLQLLCDCKEDLCKNFHAIDKAASKSSSHVLKKLFLGCLPI